MYLCPMSHDIYAAVPTRLWWAPWRWALRVYWFHPSGATNYISYTTDKTIATNVSKSEVIGLIKILGYPYEISN